MSISNSAKNLSTQARSVVTSNAWRDRVVFSVDANPLVESAILEVGLNSSCLSRQLWRE